MNAFHLLHIESPAALLKAEDAWDDLLRRSEVRVPAARAGLVADWCEHFAPGAKFCGLAVEQDGRLLAALPLVESRIGRIARAGGLPRSDWAACGDLLLDATCDVEAALDALVEGLGQLDWPLVSFNLVPYEQPRWQALQVAMERAGFSFDVHEQYRIAKTAVGDDWDAYEATRKGDHRRSRRRYARKLEQVGDVELEVHDLPSPDELEALLRRGFEIEDRSWKGEQGTSVLKTPGMFDYLLGQARRLAERGQLCLVFLNLSDKSIAFSYAWRSQGTHYCVKLGFDHAYRRFGPGQQLTQRLLQRLHADNACNAFDFWGRLVPWNESWATDTYPVGRLVASTRGGASRALLSAYRTCHPRLRRFYRWVTATRAVSFRGR